MCVLLFSDGEFMVLGMDFFTFPDDLFFPSSIWTFLSLFSLDFKTTFLSGLIYPFLYLFGFFYPFPTYFDF